MGIFYTWRSAPTANAARTCVASAAFLARSFLMPARGRRTGHSVRGSRRRDPPRCPARCACARARVGSRWAAPCFAAGGVCARARVQQRSAAARPSATSSATTSALLLIAEGDAMPPRLRGGPIVAAEVVKVDTGRQPLRPKEGVPKCAPTH